MLTRRIFNGLAVSALALGAAIPKAAFGQSPRSVARNKTLIVAVQAEAPVYRNVGQANPYSINNEDFRGSIINMFEPLFYYNSNKNEVIPWVAQSLENTPDFLTYTVKLRDGVTWSDGQPFTADDVVYTLEMLVANGKDKKDLTQSSGVASAVKAVTKVDPLTVKIELNQPDPRFGFKYLINYFDIGLQWLPAHVWKDVQDPASFSFFDLAKGWPVTTGPWRVTRFTDNQIFMDRRPDWWAVKAGLATMPAMERVITIPGGTRDRMAQLIVANQVDIVNDIQISEVMKQLVTQNPKITTFTGNKSPYGAKDWWPTSLYFNHKSAKWADLRVRRAINHYLDRKQLIDTAYAGASEPKYDPYPGFGSLKPYIDGIRPIADKYGIGHFDKAKGDALMQEAGYAKNASGIWEKDGKPLSAVIEAIPVLNAIGPVVAQQLKNSGIDASFRSTPESRAIMRDGKYDLCLFGHRGSISDPYATLENYHSRNALPVGQPILLPARWSNADYDKIVDEMAMVPPNDPRLMDLVKAAMEIWMREAVEAPISEWYHRVPMNQTYWTGWPSEEDPYMQPSFWYTSGSFGYVMPRLKPAA
jgi:peptide/nickel transport system substrate-binding protein